MAEDIISIGELEARAAAVLLAPEELDRLTARARVVASIQEGLDDHEAGRVVSHEELGRRLDECFGPLPRIAK